MLTGNLGTVYGLAFSPDGKSLASGAGSRVLLFDGQEFAVKQAKLAFEGRTIPSAANPLLLFDGTLPDELRPEYWWLPPSDLLGEEQRAFVLSKNGQEVVWMMCLPEGEGGCAGYQVVRGPIDGGGKISAVVGVAPEVGTPRGVALSPDGGTGLALYDYELLTLLDMVAEPVTRKSIPLNKAQTLQFAAYGTPVIAVGPHGKVAALGYQGGRIVLVDRDTGEP